MPAAYMFSVTDGHFDLSFFSTKTCDEEAIFALSCGNEHFMRASTKGRYPFPTSSGVQLFSCQENSLLTEIVHDFVCQLKPVG